MQLRSPALVAALLLAVSAAPAWAQSAETLFSEGAAAHDRGDLEEARARYAASFALHRAAEVAANLGVVEAQLGRHRDAAEHLAFALARYPADGDAAKRKRIALELSRVRGYVGELRLEAPDGARVTVDGSLVGSAPLVLPVYVAPGAHRVEATVEGTTSGLDVKVDAGEARDLTLGRAAAEEVPAPLVPTVDRAAPREEAPSPSSVDPVLVVGGAGLALAGVGLGITFAALSEGDDGMKTASIVSFAGGGALALATAAYVVVIATSDGPQAQTSTSRRASPARLLLMPSAHLHGGGVAAWGSF